MVYLPVPPAWPTVGGPPKRLNDARTAPSTPTLADATGPPIAVFTMKTAICARVTEALGQYVVGVQPAVMPCRASSSIHGQNGLEAGTSVNISLPGTQAGGTKVAGAVARYISTRSWRVIVFSSDAVPCG